MTFLIFIKSIEYRSALKNKTNQLNDKKQLSFQQKSNYDPNTYYKILHWSILEINSGRDINTTKVHNKTNTGNCLEFTQINRSSATLFNPSIIHEEDY